MTKKREPQKKHKVFSESDIAMVEGFKVLSDINRYRIFRILAQQPRLSITHIAQMLNISIPLASQHIRILSNAKLLQKERDGKKVFPKLEHSNPFVQAIIATIQQVIK